MINTDCIYCKSKHTELKDVSVYGFDTYYCLNCKRYFIVKANNYSW